MLALLFHDEATADPWGFDRPRIDEAFAELYLLGERPTVEEVQSRLVELGAMADWAQAVAVRWRERLAKPGWRPKALVSGTPWPRPFYVAEAVIAERGLRSLPERLADALAVAALDYLTLSLADPASASASDEARVFALVAGAVRLSALVQDGVQDAPWPSVLSCAPWRRDDLGGRLTHAGREQGRERLERWRAEMDAMQQPDEHPS